MKDMSSAIMQIDGTIFTSIHYGVTKYFYVDPAVPVNGDMHNVVIKTLPTEERQRNLLFDEAIKKHPDTIYFRRDPASNSFVPDENGAWIDRDTWGK